MPVMWCDLSRLKISRRGWHRPGRACDSTVELNMSRLHLTPPETIVPLKTAVRLLRIALTIKVVPLLLTVLMLTLRSGMDASLLVVIVSTPTLVVWFLAMLPGMDRRLGRYYLPVSLTLIIVAQAAESMLTAVLEPPLRFAPGSARVGIPLEVRTVEPLYLLLVAVIIGAWAYGRRGAWATSGLAAGLLIVGELVDLAAGHIFVPDALSAGERGFWPMFALLSALALRIPLLIVIGYIVGTLAEQERKHTQVISAANVQLREQALATVQLATARERNRLARDLHDTLAHSLAGLVVQLQAIDTLLKAEPEAARLELAKARRIAQEGLQETRHAIQDLRVNPIEDLGLSRALERAAIDFGDRAGVQIDLHISDPQASISNERAAQVYFIAREALNNIERHADARRVEVILLRNNGQVVMRVHDDGRGFDESQVDEARFGLQGMYERAEMIGAQLSVDSKVGQGTTVQLTMNNDQSTMTSDQ
jgi:signal transduction histidine kinase